MAALRVLIADDDPDSRVVMKRVLARVDCEVVGESGFGTDAVSLALETRPDLILLAVEEPTARPVDTADGLGNALPDTPIVVYSSDARPEAIRRAMVVGARDYLVKPVDALRLSDSVSAVLNQEERRQMRRAGQLPAAAVQGRGSVVTVAGAKGGVGKSMLAVNLAVALRQETGHSVVLIDADTQFGDVATLLDIAPQLSVAELVKARSTLDRDSVRQFVTPYSRVGLDVVSASDDELAWTDCGPDDLRRILDLYAQVYDFVVIDTAGPMDGFVRTCIDCSTLTLMVSSGDVSSVRDTASAVERLDRWGIDGERVRYVLNAGINDHGVSADELAAALGRPVFWVIPYDRAVVESVQTGEPVVLRRAKSRAAESVRELARRIGGRDSTNTSESSSSGSLWRRVLTGRSDVRKEDRSGSAELGSVRD